MPTLLLQSMMQNAPSDIANPPGLNGLAGTLAKPAAAHGSGPGPVAEGVEAPAAGAGAAVLAASDGDGEAATAVHSGVAAQVAPVQQAAPARGGKDGASELPDVEHGPKTGLAVGELPHLTRWGGWLHVWL